MKKIIIVTDRTEPRNIWIEMLKTLFPECEIQAISSNGVKHNKARPDDPLDENGGDTIRQENLM